MLVEDEPVTRLMLEALLRRAGYAVQSASSAEAALRLLAAGTFAVMVTDLYLEAMDGLLLMAQARALDPELEMIVLTGGATVDSAIAAMDQGAHAYLRKPVAAGELEARVAAALARRQEQLERAATLRQLGSALLRIAEPQRPPLAFVPAEERALRIGDLEIDAGRRRAVVGGRPVALSSCQFDLLLFLARRANTVQSPELLAREVLGHRCAPDEARELVKASIHRLRGKVEADAKAPKLLLSVRGAGYMLCSGD